MLCNNINNNDQSLDACWYFINCLDMITLLLHFKHIYSLTEGALWVTRVPLLHIYKLQSATASFCKYSLSIKKYLLCFVMRLKICWLHRLRDARLKKWSNTKENHMFVMHAGVICDKPREGREGQRQDSRLNLCKSCGFHDHMVSAALHMRHIWQPIKVCSQNSCNGLNFSRSPLSSTSYLRQNKFSFMLPDSFQPRKLEFFYWVKNPS